jgi:hypothetical protein
MPEFVKYLFSAILGALLSSLPTWLFTKFYYKKAGKEQRKIIEQLDDQFKDRLKHSNKHRNKLEDFEELLENSTWTETHIGNKEVWVCDSDNTYQIEKGDKIGDFEEDWTTVHPDKRSYNYYVNLKIGNTIIKELIFISMDGHRYFVPLPRTRKVEGKTEFYWDINSLRVKVCRIIGKYYRFPDLESVARFLNVSIEDIEER